jgi:hypothetical protein
MSAIHRVCSLRVHALFPLSFRHEVSPGQPRERTANELKQGSSLVLRCSHVHGLGEIAPGKARQRYVCYRTESDSELSDTLRLRSASNGSGSNRMCRFTWRVATRAQPLRRRVRHRAARSTCAGNCCDLVLASCGSSGGSDLRSLRYAAPCCPTGSLRTRLPVAA